MVNTTAKRNSTKGLCLSIIADVSKLKEAIEDSHSGDATVAFKARSSALSMVYILEKKIKTVLSGGRDEDKKNNKSDG